MAYTPHHERDAESEAKRRRLYESVTLATAIVGVVVVAISTVITAWTAVIMLEQQRIMEAQQRPWVQLSDLRLARIEWGKSEASLRIELKVKNVGQAVATEVQVHGTAVALNEGVDRVLKLIESQKQLCDERKAHEARFDSFGYSLFPGDTKDESQIVSVTRGSISAVLSKNERMFKLIVYGCATYKFYVSRAVHSTFFAYEVGVQPIEKYALYSNSIELDQEFAPGTLTLRPYLFGNQLAD